MSHPANTQYLENKYEIIDALLKELSEEIDEIKSHGMEDGIYEAFPKLKIFFEE